LESYKKSDANRKKYLDQKEIPIDTSVLLLYITFCVRLNNYGVCPDLFSQEFETNGDSTKALRLVITSIESNDYGDYKCVAFNKLGKVESKVVLYGKYYISVLYIINWEKKKARSGAMAVLHKVFLRGPAPVRDPAVAGPDRHRSMYEQSEMHCRRTNLFSFIFADCCSDSRSRVHITVDRLIR